MSSARVALGDRALGPTRTTLIRGSSLMNPPPPTPLMAALAAYKPLTSAPIPYFPRLCFFNFFTDLMFFVKFVTSTVVKLFSYQHYVFYFIETPIDLTHTFSKVI